MIDNGEKLLAFATPDGLNKIAAEKATVFTLTYNVPDDCKAGKYPITWENAFIVDENGNDITSLINLIDGAIIIEDVVTTAGYNNKGQQHNNSCNYSITEWQHSNCNCNNTTE